MNRALCRRSAPLRRILIVVLGVASGIVLGQTQEKFDKHKKFDSNGNVIETVALFPDGTVAETNYSEFDSRNRLVRSYKIEAGSSKKEWINIFRYDRKGRLKERLWYPTERMILYQRELYEYDRKGNRTLTLRYDGEGNVTLKETWRYLRGVLVKHTVAPPPPEAIQCE